jgi:hypothetical protein
MYMPVAPQPTSECPLCKGPLVYAAALAGQSVECPHCRGVFTFPPEPRARSAVSAQTSYWSWNDTGVPAQSRSRIELEIQPGESITWMEQPSRPGIQPATVFLSVFGLVWTCMTFAGTAAAYRTAMAGLPGSLLNVVPLVVTVSFTLVGLVLMLSPLLYRRRVLRSVYVLTDRRAIIFQPGWFGRLNIRSFDPERLTNLRRTQRADGSGHLILAQDCIRDSDGNRYQDVGFYGVRDVRAVEQRVRDLVQARRGSHPMCW